MSRAIPYKITVRDPETPGAPSDEHEVVFTTGELPHVQHNVARLTTDELRELGVAVLERLGVEPIAVVRSQRRGQGLQIGDGNVQHNRFG
jgi:hypothetical protein